MSQPPAEPPSAIERALTADATVLAAYCRLYACFRANRDPVESLREALAVAARCVAGDDPTSPRSA
jgi:hypothetical protein